MSNAFVRRSAADLDKRLDAEGRNVGGIDVHTLRMLLAPLTVAWDTSVSGEIIIGTAEPGAATSSPVWSVKKVLTTVAPGRILFANGDSGFLHVWDSRAGYPYS